MLCYSPYWSPNVAVIVELAIVLENVAVTYSRELRWMMFRGSKKHLFAEVNNMLIVISKWTILETKRVNYDYLLLIERRKLQFLSQSGNPESDSLGFSRTVHWEFPTWSSLFRHEKGIKDAIGGFIKCMQITLWWKLCLYDFLIKRRANNQ